MSRRGRRAGIGIASAVIFAGVLFALVHDSLYLRLLTRAVYEMTGAEVSVHGAVDFTALSPLRFEAREVTIAVDDFHGTAALVAGEIPLRPLLGGTLHFNQLTTRGVRLGFSAREAPPPRRRSRGRLPVIEDWDLEDARFDLPAPAGAGGYAVVIERLQVNPGTDARLRVEGHGTIDEAPWRVGGELGTIEALLDASQPFPMALRLELPGSRLAGTLAASGTLYGDLGAPELRDLAVHLIDGSTLDVAVSGAVRDLRAVEGVALELAVAAPAAIVQGWLAPGLGDAGRIDLHASISGGRDQLTFDDLALALTRTHPLAGTVSGRGTLAPGALSGIRHLARDAIVSRLIDGVQADLALDLSGETAAAGELAGVAIPALGAFTLRTALAGGADRWKFSALDLDLKGSASLSGHLRGAFELVVGKTPRWTVPAAELDIDARGSDASRLPPLPLIDRIDEGPWRIKARIADEAGKLGVSDLHLTAGSRSAVRLELTGAIGELGALGATVIEHASGVRLAGRVEAASTRGLARELGVSLPDLGAVDMRFDVSGAADDWTVDLTALHVAGADGFDLSASGKLDKLPRAPAYALDVTARTADAADLARQFETSVPFGGPASIEGKLAGAAAAMTFEGSAAIDATRMTGKVGYDGSGARASITAALATPTLDAGALDWTLIPGSADAAADALSRPHPEVRLFQDTPVDVSWLDAADIDVSLDASVIVSDGLRAGPLKLRARSDRRDLRVDLGEMSFEAGKIEATARFDANRSPPEFSIRGRGKSLSLKEFGARLTPGTSSVEGRYAFDVDLHASGRSPRELAATAQGHYGHVVTDAKLPGGDLDILALRPILLVLAHAHSRDHTVVACTVVELRMDKGVATLDTLFLKTEKLLAVGTGHVDLAAETLDVVVRTKPLHPGLLSLFHGKHSAHVTGPLDAPKIDPDVGSVVAGAAIDAGLVAAGVAAPPVFAAVAGFEFLGQILKSGDAAPCHAE